MFGFTFPPRTWAFCQGQILPIAQNAALFSLMGTTYGGNGTTTFGLPDLRGRVPIHFGTGGGGTYPQGQLAGEENHTVITTEMPQHNHQVTAASDAPDATVPTGNTWAAGTNQIFATAANAVMLGSILANAGGSQPHSNMQPYLVVNFSIALQGIFPSRN